MDLSQLKTQVMTMFMMKSAQRAPQTQQGSGTEQNPYNEIWSILYGMIVMNFVEYAFRHLPTLLVLLQAWALAKWKPKQKDWLPDLGKTDKEKEQIYSITLTRVFQKQTSDRETNVNVEKVDAVLEFICALDNARHVRLDTRYTIGSTEDIQLTPDLKGRVKQTSGGAGGVNVATEDISTFEIILFSTTMKLTEIRAWIDDVHKNYVFEKNNKLGNNIYYFNEIPHEPVVMTDMSGDTPKKTYKWDNMPKTLTFNMNEFKTSKSFSNVYGNHVDELKERLDLFVNHPEWYAERGIPHSLGIMLHGIPGAGKTSTIKAIAKDTHRHIFNLSLRAFTTQKQLLNLFYNESVVVHKYDGSKTSYNIPINRRVYVIEDIDCMTDVILDRSLIASTTTGAAAPIEGAGDAVTLSFLLNLLDGVLETPGRILVITSNYPEKLDKAFVRPGRIDVKIEFKNASREFIREMVSRFYSNPDLDLGTIPAELDNAFTPAEVMESLCTYFKDAEGAIKHMIQKRPLSSKAQEPCLTVQEFPVLPPLPPSRNDSTLSKDIIAVKETEEDNGTSLESLGISTAAPKNEIVGVGDNSREIKITNDIGVAATTEMTWNGQNLQLPDNFLNMGLMTADKSYIPGLNNANALEFMVPNPEFIPDTSGISGFDVRTNNPSVWSAPDLDVECIDPDSKECKAILDKKLKDFQDFLGANVPFHHLPSRR
jgi:hypothetical protein